jgi:membrane protein implicated in regulation of membrane protease activity
MAELLGKEGEVTSVDSDGDVRVHGKTWNPALLEVVGGGRLRIGDKVVLKEEADKGCLKAGEVGTIVKDDSSDLPFHVEASSGRMYWYSEADLQRAPNEASQKADGFVVGETVLIRNMPISEAKRLMANAGGWVDSMAPMLGTTGVITRVLTDRIQVSGKVWNPALIKRVDSSGSGKGSGGPYRVAHVDDRVVRGPNWKWGDQDGGAGRHGTVIEVQSTGWARVRWDAGGTNSYRMGNESAYDLALAQGGAGIREDDGGGGRLQVGERVKLTPNYSSFDDASDGPLKPGDVGELVQDDHDSKPFEVSFNGTTWYYAEAALCRADGEAAATKTTVSVGDVVTFGIDDSAVSSAQWAGCPGTSGSTRLGFSPGASYTVAQVRGAFFLTTSYDTLWAPLSALRDAPVAAASGGQLAVGDAVHIRSVGIDEARRLQDGHGEQFHKEPLNRILQTCISGIWICLLNAAFICSPSGGWADSMGPLLGTSGTVERVDGDGDVRVNGKRWNPALVERVGSLPAGKPDAKGAPRSGERLKVGDQVQLAAGYATCGDASDGPLKPGDIGEV